MDFAKAFSFFYEDEDWIKKLGIGALIVLVGILLAGIPLILLAGYELAVARNVAKGSDRPMPEWDDWGEFFKDGAMVFVAQLVYSLPIILTVCVGMVPLILAGDNEDLAAVAGILYIGCSCVAILFGLLIALLTPAIKMQYLKHGTIGACLKFGEVIQITRDNMSDMLMYVVGVIGAGLLVSLISSISVITICGPFILMFVAPIWQKLVSGHLIGQIMQKLDGNKVDPSFA